MTWSQARNVLAVVAPVVGVAAGLVAIANGWGRVESLVEWAYPVVLIALLGCLAILFGFLYVRERRPVLTMGEQAVIDRDTRNERRRAARRAVRVIRAEIAANREILNATGGAPTLRAPLRYDAWTAEHQTLAETADAEGVYAAAAAAYAAFGRTEESVRGLGYVTANDLANGVRLAEQADEKLEDFGGFLEGPRTRFVVADDRWSP